METSAVTTLPPLPPDATPDDILERLRDINNATSLVAAEACFHLTTQLAVDVLQLPPTEVDVKRKVMADLFKVGSRPEDRQVHKDAAAVATAMLTIILDDDVPQEPPPKKRARSTALVPVEDAVLLRDPDTAPPPSVPAMEPDDDGWAGGFS